MRLRVASLLVTTTAFAAAARAAREAKRPAVVSAVLMAGLAGCFGGDANSGGGGSGDPPEANIVVLPGIEAPSGTEFTFDGVTSLGAKAFFWNFGDGTTAEGSVVKHTFPGDNGRFPVTLVATDSKGRRGIDLQIVKVGTGANGAPTATMTADNLWVGLGESMTFTVAATDPDNDTLRYYWTVGPSGAAAGGGHQHGGNASGHVHGATAPADGPCEKDLPECMKEAGDTFSTVFDAPGIYVIHCHPHPWMKQLIVVEEGGSTEPVTSEIDNFRYVEPVTRVGVGTNVTWKNVDPLPHTATLEAAHAGAPLPDTGPTATWTPDALGDYMVMVMVRDEKPYTDGQDYLVGEAMPMADVRVTDVAPEGELHETRTDSFNTFVSQADPPKPYTLRFNFTANTTLDLSWASKVPSAPAQMALNVFQGPDASGTAARSWTSTASPINRVLDLPADDYTFQIVLIQGAAVDFTFKVDAIFDVRPPPAGGGHQH